MRAGHRLAWRWRVGLAIHGRGCGAREAACPPGACRWRPWPHTEGATLSMAQGAAGCCKRSPTKKVLRPPPPVRGDAEARARAMCEIFARLSFPLPPGASRQTRATPGLASDPKAELARRYSNPRPGWWPWWLRYQRKPKVLAGAHPTGHGAPSAWPQAFFRLFWIVSSSPAKPAWLSVSEVSKVAKAGNRTGEDSRESQRPPPAGTAAQPGPRVGGRPNPWCAKGRTPPPQ